MNILVTGATGFVGINLVKSISNKHNVSLFVRNKEKLSRIPSNNYDVRIGDIKDLESLKKALYGIDVCIHLAGLIKSFNESEFYSINRFGCLNVAKAAAYNGVKKVIYISSLAARGPNEGDRPVSVYGFSKLLGEFELSKYVNFYDLTIIRPPIIYGPHEVELFKFFKLAKYGFLPTMRERYFSFIHVEDLVNAISMLITHNVGRLKLYYISDGIIYSWDDVVNTIFDSLLVQGLAINVPKIVIKSILFLHSTFKMSTFASVDKLREVDSKKWVCYFSDLHKDIGFLPKYDIKRGFLNTVEWYRNNGWI